MQAYKLKGTIDHSGHLVINDPIAIPPGDVEVIVWPSEPMTKTDIRSDAHTEPVKKQRPSKIKALESWFAKTEPAPPDFDPDRARWEALKEKYDL